MLISKVPVIAREGWPILYATVLLGAALGYFVSPWLALPFFLLVLFFLYLFRDPARKVPALPLAVVSPVDGVVQSIQEGIDPFLQREAIRLDLMMNPLGVFSLRSPIEGKLQQQWHGTTVSQDVKYAQCVQTDEKDQVVWGVVVHSMFDPRCYAQPGERLGQGQRCGYLSLGGQVVVWLPANSRIKVKQGERVLSGESEIATLVHSTAVSSIAEEGNL